MFMIYGRIIYNIIRENSCDSCLKYYVNTKLDFLEKNLIFWYNIALITFNLKQYRKLNEL